MSTFRGGRSPVRRSTRSIVSSGALSAAFVVVLAVAAVACSSATTPSSSSSAPTTAPPASSSPAAQASSPAPTGGLSGKWSGHYSGAYSGTFTVTWVQSGSTLSGTIDLSDLGGKVPINGTVNGDSITFGTVGSMEIQYSGSVSGSSMSGTYKIQTSSGSVGGPWSASRSS